MKTIEVITPQNVTIEYELASVAQRAIAKFIDILVIYIPFTFVINNTTNVGQTFSMLLFLVTFIFLSALQEYLLHGKTIGKLALQIRVLKENGEPASFPDLILRACFQIIDIFTSVGLLAFFSSFISSKNQRFGDIVSRIIVIQENTTNKYTLADLEKINSLENYKPVYEKANIFTEKEMLLIKAVLRRFNEHKNEAHILALNTVSQKVAAALEVEKVPKDKELFLKTVLKDYIILTR